MKRELIFIKLGGSIITDKSREFTARLENIKRLAKEIRAGQKVFSGKIIIGHGAGSFAHVPAKKFETKKGLINSKSLIGATITEDAARSLNAILMKIFLDERLPVFPFSPASFLISDVESYGTSYLDPIENALDINAIPVVYGDVVMDASQGFTIFSTEKVLSLLAKKFVKKYKIRQILVTDVDGVYDENGKTIPAISEKNFDQIKVSIGGAKNVDVTGGMLHKVSEALSLAKSQGIQTLVINGKTNGNLRKAIVGEKVISTKIL